MTDVELRPIEDADLDALFDQMRDPESVRMAAFTSADPHDRAAFDAHLAKVRASPDGTLRAVLRGGRLVGSIASFVMDGDTESPTGSTVRSGRRASPAGPLPCSSTW